jgi:putative transposase
MGTRRIVPLDASLPVANVGGMARMARVVVPGYPHHVTQTGVPSRALFGGEPQYRAYLRVLAEQCRNRRVEILAWCLLPERVLLVAVPRRPGSLARAIGEAHKRYTRWRNSGGEERGRLFRGRFRSCVLDLRHLVAAARGSELAPVRRGLAGSAGDWPWSSAAYHLGRRRGDPLVSDRSLGGAVGDWAELLAGTDDDAEVSLRLATRTGRPAGDRKFFLRIERLAGRDLRRRRAGRPAGRHGR